MVDYAAGHIAASALVSCILLLSLALLAGVCRHTTVMPIYFSSIVPISSQGVVVGFPVVLVSLVYRFRDWLVPPDLVTAPMRRQIWWWALIGLALRLLIMPVTVHGDLLVMQFSAHQLAYYGDLIPGKIYPNQLVYPVPIYVLMAALQVIFRPLMPYYQNIGQVLNNQALFGWYATPHRLRYLFLLKSHYLLFDYALAFVLLRLPDNAEERRWVFKMWMLCPVTLYGTFAWGQFDVIPALFTVAACWAATRQRVLWAAFFLGIGAAFKNYPVLLLPFVVILARPRGLKLLWTLVLGLAPYGLAVLPYFLRRIQTVAAFQGGQALLTEGENRRLFDARLEISYGHALLYYVVIYGLIVSTAYLLAARRHMFPDLWRYSLAVLLLAYPFIAFHPYWLLWVWPLLLVGLAGRRTDRGWLLFGLYLMHLLIIVLDSGKPLTTDLLAPVIPSIIGWPDIRQILTQAIPTVLLSDITRSLLLSFSLVFAGYILRRSGSKPQAETARESL